MTSSSAQGSPRPSLHHPGRWFWLILLVPVALGLARLRFDVEVFDLLPNSLKAVQGLKLYQEHFANARELIVTLHAANAEQATAAARAIAERLRSEPKLANTVTWEPPWLEHPDQAAELMAYLWLNQPPAEFRQLAEHLAPTNLPEILSTARENLATSLSPDEIARLSYDPFGLTRLPESAAGAAPTFEQGQESFASADGTFRIMFVQARPELRSYSDCERWLIQVRGLCTTAMNANPELSAVRLGFTGRPAFVAEVAGGMQHDITTSVGGTAAIIALLFWLAHRRIKPMLWLLALLALVLGCTLALGGLIFGTINVVSMGFAAILLGLAVDYAVVHYQEALAHPNLSIPQIRHAIAPSIFWAAVTTITAFLVLNFGGLPGLGQLGTLVGLGVALAATIMIFEFLPPLFPGRNQTLRTIHEPKLPGEEEIPLTPTLSPSDGEREKPSERAGFIGDQHPRARAQKRWVFRATVVIILFTIGVLIFGLPPIDPTANALRPRHSPAYTAVDEIQTHLNQKREPLWLIIRGTSVTNVAERLRAAQTALTRGVDNHLIAGFTLPTPLWPEPSFQETNRAIACRLVGERQVLREAALTNGFTERAVALTERVLDTWQSACVSSGIFWPTNPMSQWIFEKATARNPTNFFVLGLINPISGDTAAMKQARLGVLEWELPKEDIWLSGWELLGGAIFGRVKANMWKVLGPMVVLVLLSLFLAFRRPLEISLSLAVLLLSGLCVLTIMKLTGWTWNLLNLMVIPLVLGTGVDYSIFMQLALRRFGGDLRLAYYSVGRALLLCGGTAIAGFGSLGLSSNAGMASLGRVCAVGIGSNMLIAIFLLPIWWQSLSRKQH